MSGSRQRWSELRARAVELARTFEQRSVASYEEGAFVAANLADLRQAGITAMNVPEELGGCAATLAENVEIVRLLSKGCGSTGFTLGIHAILTGGLRNFAEEPLRTRIFTAVRDGAFVCGPFTDTGSGGNFLFPSTVARRTEEGGYVLEGVKRFFTGYEACTHMVITAALTDEHLQPPFNMVAFFTPKPDGLDEAIVARWSGFALPMTGSHSVAIRALPVSADELIAPEGLTPMFAMAQQQWGHYCFAAVFLGLAERAWEVAIETTRGRSNTAVRSPLSLMPGVQFALGEMRARLGTMRALLTEYVTHHAEPGDDLMGFLAQTCVPKYFIANEAQHVVRLAFDVIGGTGTLAGKHLGQTYHNVRAGALLPFNNDLCREFIGKTALGIDPTSAPRWL
jgi:alkylation response protein AidB-like acyl-CoA dehydrogenase